MGIITNLKISLIQIILGQLIIVCLELSITTNMIKPIHLLKVTL